jgi:hypothetical protein
MSECGQGLHTGMQLSRIGRPTWQERCNVHDAVDPPLRADAAMLP